MRNLFLFILIILTINCSYSQSYENSVSGKVTSAKTGEPLPYVNIFISNSTWGTTSDMQGFYKLSSIRPGKQELVFSMIGFKTQVITLELNNTSIIFLEISLEEKVYEFDEVKISGDQPKEWFEDLEFFKEKFFGYTKDPIICKILNEYYLEFSHSNKNLFIAECEIPLEIINYTLGYNLKCEIIKFEYDYWSKTLHSSYKIFFTELNNETDDYKQYQISLRNKIYKGSIFYFLRELASNRFMESGFKIYNTASASTSSPLPGLIIDSSTDILEMNKEDGTYKIYFDDYLNVLYYNDFHLESESWIKLNYPYVTIDKYGYPEEEIAFTILGSWAKRGVASYLPKNFILENDSR